MKCGRRFEETGLDRVCGLDYGHGGPHEGPPDPSEFHETVGADDVLDTIECAMARDGVVYERPVPVPGVANGSSMAACRVAVKHGGATYQITIKKMVEAQDPRCPDVLDPGGRQCELPAGHDGDHAAAKRRVRWSR